MRRWAMTITGSIMTRIVRRSIRVIRREKRPLFLVFRPVAFDISAPFGPRY